MCGIAGSIGLPLELATPIAEKMRRALAHRGPDDQGTEVLWAERATEPVVLAHNRLAIIDLSTAGHEPMLAQGRALALTFNGEIYNFRELRSELRSLGYEFRSQTDAEVILAAYKTWGVDAAPRFRGMFAFVLADASIGRVWLCRDRLGIKPLYVTRPKRGGLLFASELRALLAAGPALVPPRVSPSALESFLSQGMVCGLESIVDGVSLVPTATNVVVDWTGREVERRRFWWLSFPSAVEEASPSRTSAIDLLGEQLRQAMRLHLISDVPLGIFLSGGVDSSALATIASELQPQGLHTLSIGFDQPDFDETKEATELASALGTEHSVVRITGPELLDDIEHVLAAMDQPTVDGFNTFVVSRAARQAGLTVALSGLGGDELFGGYRSFRDVPLATSVRRLLPFSVRFPNGTARWAARFGGRATAKALELVARPASTVESYLLRRELFLLPERRSLHDATWSGLKMEGLLSADLSRLSEPNQVSALELTSYMRDMLLRDADVFSMAVGLELRVPLLDHAIVDTVARLPGKWKTSDPRPKPLLLDAVGSGMPAPIGERQKRGFTFPWNAWLRGPMRDRARQCLMHKEVWQVVGIDPQVPSVLWDRFEDGDPVVGGLQIMALWVLQDYIERNQLTLA
jgi:asparagine synthase (glutamine-hydrolysing)